MSGTIVVEMIPYKDFWEKVRLVAYYAYELGAKVEIMDKYIYVEYRRENEDEDIGSIYDSVCDDISDSTNII